MNENIDLTKILKDCPKGWKFYSDIYDEVTFWGFSDLVYPIQLNTKNHGAQLLSEKGEEIIGNGKCILFPSKDQRDWSKFQIPAKRGDIMMFIDKSAVFMIDTKKDTYTDTIAYASNHFGFKIGEHIVRSYIPASEDMKEKLFAAIDKAGYEWDGETLKKKPQFKPFDKVLVRNGESWKWKCAFYSYFESYSTYPHVTSNGAYIMCIPFEGNEHLVGTTKNP